MAFKGIQSKISLFGTHQQGKGFNQQLVAVHWSAVFRQRCFQESDVLTLNFVAITNAVAYILVGSFAADGLPRPVPPAEPIVGKNIRWDCAELLDPLEEASLSAFCWGSSAVLRSSISEMAALGTGTASADIDAIVKLPSNMSFITSAICCIQLMLAEILG